MVGAISVPSRHLCPWCLAVNDRMLSCSGSATKRAVRASLLRRDRNRNIQEMFPAAQHNATDRAHVVVIAPPGENDMLVVDQEVVGRIDIDPADIRTEERHPG